MRYNKRYTRVLGIITDPAIPRTKNGGIALCHLCQRSVSFANGFLPYVIKTLNRLAVTAVILRKLQAYELATDRYRSERRH